MQSRENQDSLPDKKSTEFSFEELLQSTEQKLPIKGPLKKVPDFLMAPLRVIRGDVLCDLPKTFKSIYKFDATHKNYVKALVHFNKNVAITNINGTEISEDQGVFCKDLPRLLKNLSSNRVTLRCSSTNAQSTVGVFPKLNKRRLTSNLEKSRALLIDKILSKIVVYLQESSETNLEGERLNLSALDRAEALILLHKLDQVTHLSGAIHFVSQQKILFQHKEDNFILTYGKESSLYKTDPFGFDIDDGFRRYCLPQEGAIKKELSQFFEAWKKNDYQGPIIPKAVAGFNEEYYKTVNEIIAANVGHAFQFWRKKEKKEGEGKKIDSDPIPKWINEETISHTYDPDNDVYYRISYLGECDPLYRQKELVLGHVNGGGLAELKWMKQANYSFDVEDENGLSPLMIAAKRGYKKIVRWLLEIGVDPSKENKNGETAYKLAIANEHTKIADQIKKDEKGRNSSLSKAPRAAIFSHKKLEVKTVKEKEEYLANKI